MTNASTDWVNEWIQMKNEQILPFMTPPPPPMVQIDTLNGTLKGNLLFCTLR